MNYLKRLMLLSFLAMNAMDLQASRYESKSGSNDVFSTSSKKRQPKRSTKGIFEQAYLTENNNKIQPLALTAAQATAQSSSPQASTIKATSAISTTQRQNQQIIPAQKTNEIKINEQQMQDFINQLSFRQQIQLERSLQSLLLQAPTQQPIILKYHENEFTFPIRSITNFLNLLQDSPVSTPEMIKDAPAQSSNNSISDSKPNNSQPIASTKKINLPATVSLFRRESITEKTLPNNRRRPSPTNVNTTSTNRIKPSFKIEPQPSSSTTKMRVSNISPIFMQSPAEIFPANKPESSPKQDAFTEYLPAQQRGPVIFHETPIEKPIESNSTKTAYNHEKDSRVAAKVNIEYNQEHVENESIIAKKTSEKLHNLFNTTLFNLLKKKFRLSASTRMIEFSLADTVVETIKLFLFQLSGLSEHLNSAVQNNFIENFKNNMQSLEQKIGNYNTSSMYKNPEKMLLLLQAMVQFLKENISIQFSPDMLTMLDKTMHLATICCDLCKAENIIFSTTNAPVQVLAQFQESIDETQNLSKKEYSNDLVFAIYKKQGSVQNVIQNWNDFKKNPLYKTPVNRQYAAFLTLLLLFENTIIATAMVINEINLEYSAISTTPIIINIA